jgi:hypothetical protein
MAPQLATPGLPCNVDARMDGTLFKVWLALLGFGALLTLVLFTVTFLNLQKAKRRA